MKKKIAISLLVLVAASSALVFVNYKASEAIHIQLQQVNQSYAEMAAHEGLPALQLAHGAISANVLTSNYRLHDVQLTMEGLGQVMSLDSIRLSGFKPNTLANKGRVQLNGLSLGTGMTLLMPDELSAFVKSVRFHGDYRYRYSPSSGELWLSQQTSINDELHFSYQFNFSNMQPLWQWLGQVFAMDSEQQQELVASASSMDDIYVALRQVKVNDGEIKLINEAFLERLLTFTFESGHSPSLDAVRGMAMMTLAMTDGVPAEFKQSLMSFIERPKSLTLRFQFAEPISIEALESGSAFAEFDSPQAMLEFSGVRLEANER